MSKKSGTASIRNRSNRKTPVKGDSPESKWSEMANIAVLSVSPKKLAQFNNLTREVMAIVVKHAYEKGYEDGQESIRR